MANITVPVTVKSGTLPLGMSPTAVGYTDAFQKRLSLSLSGDSVVIGSIGSTTPIYDKGPWFSTTDNSWRYWDYVTGQYLPTVKAIGSSSVITLSGTPTANRTVTFPDKSGTVARLLDIYAPLGTSNVSNPYASTINIAAPSATTPDTYIFKLTQPVAVQVFPAMTAGQQLTIVAINAGTSYAISWSGSIVWPSGFASATSQAVSAMTNVGTLVSATVPSTTGMAQGQVVTISGATGMTNVNGTWAIAGISSGTVFTFQVGVIPTGAYTAGSATAATPYGPIQAFSSSAGQNATSVYILRASDVTGSLKYYGEAVSGYGTADATTYEPGGPDNAPFDYGHHPPVTRTQGVLPQ